MTYHGMERSDTKVRIFGDVAIITGKAVFEVTSRNRGMTLNLLFHAVWAKRGSSLQFVSWQATRLPD